jgi:peptidoglycan-N-acetylglucosamine deacetylase
VAASWKPMLVTAALVGVVLVVDDATTARSGDARQSVLPAPAASTHPAATPAGQATGVIQTTGVPGPTVALTFDDGPSPHHTTQVLDILDEHGVKAVFCVVGESVRAYPELVEKIVDRGHTLCDHTATHDLHLPDRSEDRIRTEIGGTLQDIRAAVPDAEVPFYRAPGGNFTADDIAVAASYGQQPLGWSVDPQDWTEPGSDAIRTTVLDQVVAGSVVLLHDGGGDQSGTATALDGIITAVRSAGFEFVIPTS